MGKKYFILSLVSFSLLNFAAQRELILKGKYVGKDNHQRFFNDVDKTSVQDKNDLLVRGIRNMLPCAVVSCMALSFCCCLLCNGSVNVSNPNCHCATTVIGSSCVATFLNGGEEGCRQICASNVCNDAHCLKKCSAVCVRECVYGSGCCPRSLLKRLDDLLRKDENYFCFAKY